MGIRDFLNRLKGKRQKYKEFEGDMDVQEQYYERKKSANERELEKYMEEEREKAIKLELQKFREARRKEYEFGHNSIHTKNMFENEKPVIMKEKKLFSGKSNLNTRGGLFFK